MVIASSSSNDDWRCCLRHKETCMYGHCPLSEAANTDPSLSHYSMPAVSSLSLDANLKFQQSEDGLLLIAWCEICGYSDGVVLR
jgi:hypothetical protein